MQAAQYRLGLERERERKENVSSGGRVFLYVCLLACPSIDSGYWLRPKQKQNRGTTTLSENSFHSIPKQSKSRVRSLSPAPNIHTFLLFSSLLSLPTAQEPNPEPHASGAKSSAVIMRSTNQPSDRTRIRRTSWRGKKKKERKTSARDDSKYRPRYPICHTLVHDVTTTVLDSGAIPGPMCQFAIK